MTGPNPFSLKRTSDGDVGIVAVRGDVDHQEAAALGTAIAQEAGPVVVDLRRCTFMGSDGLRALLEGRRDRQDRGQRLVVQIEPTGPIARLFDVVGGATIFNVWTGDDTAGAAAEAARSDRRRSPDRRAGRRPGPAGGSGR